MLGPLQIIPNYAKGFTFSWSFTPDVVAGPPWLFRVQESDNGRDGWRTLTELVNVFSYTEPTGTRIKFTFDIAPYFRIEANLGGQTYHTPARTALGDLDRSDWLVAREIMRQVYLTYNKGRGGHPVAVFQRLRTGINCTLCRDQVSGQILDPRCKQCLGTGMIGGYHGPYKTWAQFSLRKPDKKLEQMTEEVAAYSITMVAGVHCNREDIVIDLPSGRAYTVIMPTSIYEIRRIPIVYGVAAVEQPPDRIVYDLFGRSITSA